MLSYRTQGFNPYSVAYSPFYDSKIAVSAAANFGLVGNGRLYVLDLTETGQIAPQAIFDTQDGLFDLAWSEINENQVVASSGDGTIKLFDLTTATPPQPGQNQTKINFPLQVYKEHTREVFSVNWNLVQKHLFCSASWDGTIKVWSMDRGTSIATFVAPIADHSSSNTPQSIQQQQHAAPKSHVHAPGSGGQSAIAVGSGPGPGAGAGAVGTAPASIHAAMFSPHDPNIIASVHADSHIRIWDTRAFPSLTHDFLGHGGVEALTVDWNKYRPTVLATGGVDKVIKVWDLRMAPNISTNNQIDARGSTNGGTGVPIGQGPSYVQHSIIAPINELLGHDYAVKRVIWSPHAADTLISTSYDMTARVWRDLTASGDNSLAGGSRYMSRLNHGSGILNTFNNHTEFVMGADWSLWGEPGWVATVGWDEMLYAWKAV